MKNRFHRTRWTVMFIMWILTWISPAFSNHPHLQESPASDTVNTGQLTPEMTLNGWSIRNLQFSPDGSRLAMQVSEPVKGDMSRSNLWILDVRTEELFRATTSEKSDHSPQWAPDGKTLAFLSSRNEKTQIYLLPMRGGEAWALTESKTSIQSFIWSPDGTQIVYSAKLPETDEEEKRKKDKDDARLADKDDKHALLWILNVESQKARQLTEGGWRISEYQWIPESGRLLVSATDHPQPELQTSRLYFVALSDGTFSEFFEPARPYGRIKVSPDGQHCAYSGTHVDGPDAHDLFVVSLSGGEAENLTRAAIDRPVTQFLWKKNGDLLIQAATGFTTSLYTVGIDGKVKRQKPYGIDPSGSIGAHGKTIAFVGQTATELPELWISKKAGKAQQISHFNAHWDSLELPVPERFRYRSFDGTEIEAALILPHAEKSEDPLPLAVLIHGGPSGRWADRFDAWGQLLASRGFAVFYPNIRGSVGYGYDFLAMNRRDWGGGDFKDIMAGVDVLIEKGIADSSRLAIGGWSYGGYMAAWVVTQTHRFKASVSGAPMIDLAFEYGSEMNSINAYDTWYMGTPYENLELFNQRSPITFVKQVKTPTLLICGENDVIDPIEQCRQFYRGLKRYGVETEFVIYPREGHGIREEKHRIDLLNRMLDWFTRYLK